MIDSIIGKATFKTENLTGVTVILYKTVPLYTFFHCRFLHDEVKNSSEEEFKNSNYYKAFYEAVKWNNDRVKSKSKVKVEGCISIISNSFGITNIRKQ